MLYKIHGQNLFKVPEPRAIFKILDWKLKFIVLQRNWPPSMLLLLQQ